MVKGGREQHEPLVEVTNGERHGGNILSLPCALPEWNQGR